MLYKKNGGKCGRIMSYFFMELCVDSMDATVCGQHGEVLGWPTDVGVSYERE